MQTTMTITIAASSAAEPMRRCPSDFVDNC